MSSEHFQTSFVKQLKRNLPEHAKPADVIAEKLGISVASAYRKLGGQTPFSVEDISKLCSEYLISLDEAMYSDPNQVVIFKKTQEVANLDSLINYFHATLQQLEALRNIPEARLYYAARDLPLFFYFKNPSLAAFKVLVWLKDSNNDILSKNEVFDFNKIPTEVLELGAKLHQVYNNMPTSEIWTTRTLANVLEQILYYYNSGLLNNEDALKVIEDVSDILDERELKARENKKQDNLRAELYSCDYLMMANGALAKVGPRRIAWVAFSGINFVHTANPRFCEDYEKAFMQHANLGVLISGSAEKQRAEFFRKLREQLNAVEVILKADMRYA